MTLSSFNNTIENKKINYWLIIGGHKMRRRVKKLIILVGIVTFTFLGGAHGGVIISLAAGPGETAQAVAKPVTYNQQSVKALGNWEQQGNTWKFKCLDGRYLTNAWIESLSEAGAYYYVGTDGNMLVNSKTSDGYWVDGNGVWRSGVQNTENNGSEANSGTQREKKYDQWGNEIMDYSYLFDETYRQDLKDHPIDPVYKWASE